MTSPFGCFACSGASHWEPACPELAQPAARDRKEHESRIAKYVQWMWDGRVTAQQKRQLIEHENAEWAKALKEKEKAK